MVPHPELNTLAEELKNKKDVLSVAVFGSYARGDARPDSDIDLLVLTKNGVRRDVEKRGKTTFEFVYVSYAEAMKYYKDHPNNCVQLWKDAIVLFDRNGSMRKLAAFAKRLEKKGKPPISASKLSHLRFDVEDAVRAMEALAITDAATANLYAHIKASDLTELYFDTRQIWTPPPKKQLVVMRTLNKKDAKIFDDFFTSADLSIRLRLLQKMIRIVFG